MLVTEEFDPLVSLIEGALNTSRSKKVILRQVDYGCIIDEVHRPGVEGYMKVERRVEGKRKSLYMHRLVFQMYHGLDVIPEDQTINHLCNNRGCLNPTHMHLVAQADHNRITNREKYSVEDAFAHAFWKETQCNYLILMKNFPHMGRSKAYALIKGWKEAGLSR